MTQNAIITLIIAAIIQMLPLILIPIFLIGILNSVPVIGKFAQNALNNNKKRARDYAKNDDNALGGLRAQYKSGERNLLGMRNRSGRPTLGERGESWKRARNGRRKASEEIGQARYDERREAADLTTGGGGIDGWIARSAKRSELLERNAKQQIESASGVADNEWDEAKTGGNAHVAATLRAAGVDPDAVSRRALEQKATTQSRTLAADQLTTNFADAQLNDAAILKRSAGGVNQYGEVRAQAYGEQTAIQQHQKDVDAASSLLGNGAEAGYGAGLRVIIDASGNKQWATVTRDKRTGAIIRNAAGTEILSQQSKDVDATVKRANIGSKASDLSEAAKDSVIRAEQYSVTPIAAEAALTKLASTGQLTEEQFYHYTDSYIKAATDAHSRGIPGNSPDDIKSNLTFMTNQVNAAAKTSYQNKNSVNADGVPIFGGQKGGTTEDYKGTLDKDGFKGFDKMASKNQSPVFDVNKTTGVLEQQFHQNGAAKGEPISGRRKLAQLMIEKATDPTQQDAFNSGLIGVGRDVLELQAVQMAKEYDGVSEYDEVSIDPTKGTYSATADGIYRELLARQANARNLR